MERRRRGTPDTSRDAVEDQGPAPADLLQMWISGRTAGAAPSAAVAPETAEGPGYAGPTDDAAPAVEPPTAKQSWWPADDQDQTSGEPTSEPSRWWPYAEPAAGAPNDEPGRSTDQRPGSSALAGVDTVADDSPWRQDRESEWTTADSDAPPGRAPSVGEHPNAYRAEPAERDAVARRARGWASFGTAPTAEDVLDRLDTQVSWSDQFAGAPRTFGAQTPANTQTAPADPVADESPAASVQADRVPPPPAAPLGLDMSSTAHWTLDDFEEYIRSQSGNELSEWIGGHPADLQDAVAADSPADEPDPGEPSLAPSPAAAAATPKGHPSRVRGLMTRIGLSRKLDAPGLETTPVAVEAPVNADADFRGPTPRAAEEPPDEAAVSDPAPDEPVVDALTTSEAAPGPVDSDHDQHQDWYDDSGLRWSSEDGGYTWFSVDGQGWNAETGESIEVPVGSVPTSTAPEKVPAAPEVTPTEPVSDATSAALPAEPPTIEVAPPAGVEAEETRAIEYRRRGRFRTLLGVLVAVTAVFVVAAIFWAVSQGSQAATGIAVGATGFALAAWWGLLSWIRRSSR